MSIDRRRFLGACTAGIGVTALAGKDALAGSRNGRAGRPGLPASVHHALGLVLRQGFPGAACGVLAHGREYAAGDGRIAGHGSARPDGDTVFQLGSVTKTFTGLLLAEADRRGLVRLDDPVARHVPWSVPSLHGRPITLADLGTHTSGLPRIPEGLQKLPGFDPADPYRAVGREDLGRWLAGTELRNEPGTAFEYSNFGFAVLGQALARQYEPLLRSVTVALGLSDTTLHLAPWQRQRKATGHNPRGEPVPDWTGEVFAPVGSMTYSTVRDQLRYLRHQLRPGKLGGSIRRTQRPWFTVNGQLHVGLDWLRTPLRSGRTMVWHNGETGGFTAFVGFCPESDEGVVLLANGADDPQNPKFDKQAVRLLNELDSAVA